MRLFVAIFCLVMSGGAVAREAKEQRARRDLAVRGLLIALDDGDGGGVEASVGSLAQNLEPEGVKVFAPLKGRLLALASDLKVKATVDPRRVRAAVAEATDLFGVDTAPPLTPDRGAAAAIYQAQCRSCHGDAGGGDGVLAAKVPGGVPSFVRGAAASKSPFSLYQKIAGGKAGTPMPGYDKKLEPNDLWALAFLCASFDAAPAPKAPDVAALVRRGLSLDRLARANDAELLAWAGDPALLGFLRSQAPFLPAIPRAGRP